MDTDTTDATSGVGDSLNGETKPDPAKLAQTAIIKQDVMLSGISTQSPASTIFTLPTVSMSPVAMGPGQHYSNHIRHKDVMLSGTSTQSPASSVLTMPTVSMPTVSMPTGSMATTLGSASLSGHGGLPDSLFMPVTNDVPTTESKPDISAAAASQPVTGLSSQQLLGQPQVAPQFIVTSPTLPGQGGTTMPLQQLLIPVSTGNGAQQLISIPVSLAAGAGGQIQLLTTSNGQLIATNLSSLTQPINNTVQLANTGAPAAQSTTTSSQAGSHILTHNTQHVSTTSNTQAAATASAAAAVQPSVGLPQLITNAQGQVIAIGAPPQVLPQSVAVTQSPSSTSLNHVLMNHSSTTPSQPTLNTPQPIAHTAPISQTIQHVSTPAAVQGLVAGSNSVTMQPQVMTVSQPATSTLTTSVTQSINQLLPNVGSDIPLNINQLLPNVGSDIALNINQLLPNTVSNSTESTTVDGINLDEIKEFAKQFKIRRLSLGLTQTQVGQALSATEGPSYSQSAICSCHGSQMAGQSEGHEQGQGPFQEGPLNLSLKDKRSSSPVPSPKSLFQSRTYPQQQVGRFEKLDITPKSAQKIKPVLERWMLEAEERYKNGVQNLTEFIGSEPSKKRKRRTSFTPQALEHLNEHFERNTHPSGAEMTELSEKLNYDREVIRVWFCNKRQALKNTIKKLKSQEPLS